MMDFAPNDWFWTVEGDDTRAWSSAVGGYVNDWPADQVTHLASEEVLIDVLQRFGLPTPPPTLENWRKTAQMTRVDFVNAAADMGLLNYDDAVAAAKGDWPASFNAALPSDETAARQVKVLWAGVTMINRNAPLIAAIIASPIPITEALVDILFGWTGD